MVQKAVQLDPQNGAYLDSLGWVYFKMGQYALAEANLRKASERIGQDPAVHDHLGELYEKTGRLKMAAGAMGAEPAGVCQHCARGCRTRRREQGAEEA